MSDTLDTTDYDENGPACIACRKRKRRCSREEPCKMCYRSGVECVYENPRKRGVKKGIVEVLKQRIDHLEAMVMGQNILLEPFADILRTSKAGGAPVIPLVATENTDHKDLKRQVEKTTEMVLDEDNRNMGADFNNNNIDISPRKKRCLSDGGSDLTSDRSILPPWEIIEQLLPIYFDQIHPWIPILHQPSLMAEITRYSYHKHLRVLQSIVAVTIKFLDISAEEQSYFYQRCRECVLLACMDRFSIETLRAAIILGFDTIGCGKGPRSWSIVSSATRIVEQLGLSVEEDDEENNILLNRIGFLEKSKSPSEREERRRIFWALFLMDRFCSVTTGWNTSMMSSTIRRRLPMEGWYFSAGNDKKARYFNISETNIDTVDEEDALGGYSYLVEATECLSKVASFLLKEKINSQSIQASRDWLTKFQALDSMLIRWKISLPAKGQSLRSHSRGMDENLTVAHITHNTSVLLLHHNLAFPPPELKHWKSRVRSVNTCIAAAVEISHITMQFLSRVQRICSPQFTFCAFIAARTLLAYQIHTVQPREDLNDALNSLIEGLKVMSTRWIARGPYTDNLALNFVQRLEAARNSKSEINARKTVFADDSDTSDGKSYGINNISLASPPVAELLNGVTEILPDNEINDKAPLFGELEFLTRMVDADYLFSWGNGDDVDAIP